MRYFDPVYGSTAITQPVLLDVLQSDAMQRLKGVLQHGISGLIGVTAPVTRFEHSVGVMILVERMGGRLHEQIAALLHDVSHTAFSHVIDYVFHGHDSQSYHDQMKSEYVAGTDLPALLARHGFDWRSFMDEERFPLLEQPAPRLCADRLDYFLRDSLELNLATPDEVATALANLVTVNNRIAVADEDIARWLGDTYMAADEASWANFREVGLYELTARAIRRALAADLIDVDDFWGIDRQLWAKLKATPNPGLQAELELVSPATRFIWDETAPTFRVSTKLRTIDPDVVTTSGRVRPLSELDPAFAGRRRAYLNAKKGSWPMRVIPPPRR